MKDSLRIALIVPTAGWYDRALIDGIAAYSRAHGPWRLVLQTDTEHHLVAPWLRRWQPDGVLARITGSAMAARLRGLRIPVVDLLEESGASGIPRIVCDDRELVQRAVNHLLDRHFRHFAYVGRRDYFFARQRRTCFREYIRLRADGVPLTAQDILLPWKSMPHLHVELADWLRELPKPVGVIACNDVWAAQVLRVCHEFDLQVPQEIAVIGIDNDPLICQMGTPTLSSVDVNARAIGYRAAAMLHGMIARAEEPPPITFVEPGPVQSRASTDTIAIPNAQVVEAIRLLRAHACERVPIRRAVARFGISRRTLEREFLRHVGHSPTAEITRSRLERAKELLTETDLPLAAVARRAGFAYPETLQRAFKKHVGLPPGEYRRNHRVELRHPAPRTRRRPRSPGPGKRDA